MCQLIRCLSLVDDHAKHFHSRYHREIDVSDSCTHLTLASANAMFRQQWLLHYPRLPQSPGAAYVFHRRSGVYIMYDISKTDAAGIPNLTQNYSTTSTGNPLILRSKSQSSRSQDTKTVPAWVTSLLWVLASSSLYCVNQLDVVNLLLTDCQFSLDLFLPQSGPPLLSATMLLYRWVHRSRQMKAILMRSYWGQQTGSGHRRTG